jgi:surfeit locus 1 family protein
MRGLKLYGLLLFSIASVVILLALGFWQLERREWKRELLAELRHALSDTAPLREFRDAEPDQGQDYIRVRLKGVFDHAQERYLFAVAGREPGWQVITPLKSVDRRLVLVNRGFIPERLKEPASRRDSLVPGEVEIIGLLRKPARAGPFTPANQPDRNTWYWADAPALLDSLAIPRGFLPSLRIVEALPQSSAADWPRPMPPDPRAISNNHLQYAVTWFALAGILVIMTGILLRSGARSPPLG